MLVGFGEKRCRKNLPLCAATRMRFKIEFALEPRIGAVFARHLDDADFTLVDGSTLGGIPIKPELTMPRALDADGNPRMDLFAFRPCVKADVERFVVGEIVELVIPNA